MKITISGSPGSGKSTVAVMLAKELGLVHYSSGDKMREMALAAGKDLAKFSREAEKSDKIDHELDLWQQSLNSEDNFIIDSRLGWHFIPSSVKIYLDVDPEIGGLRIFKQQRGKIEGGDSVEELVKMNKKRIKSENKRYAKYYSLDIHDKDNYDIWIDTSHISAKQVVEEILERLKQ